jgi:ankyrin repeat protein
MGVSAVCESCLAAGQDPDESDDAKVTALMHATSGGSLEVVEELIAAGADVNATSIKGFTPLLYCLSTLHPKKTYIAIVALLLKAGADVCAVTRDGMSAFELARERGFKELSEMLISAKQTNKQLDE